MRLMGKAAATELVAKPSGISTYSAEGLLELHPETTYIPFNVSNYHGKMALAGQVNTRG